MATRSRIKQQAEFLATSMATGPPSSPRQGSAIELVVSQVDSRSLLDLYFEANSEESWFTAAQAEAEFTAFSGEHVKKLALEVDGGAGGGEELQSDTGEPSLGFPLTHPERLSDGAHSPEMHHSATRPTAASQGRLKEGGKKRTLEMPPSVWKDFGPIAAAKSTGPASLSQKRRRKRGAQSSASFKGARKQRRVEVRQGGREFELRRQTRLLQRALTRSKVLAGHSYSILEDGSVSSTGWQGSPPPRLTRDSIISRYHSGEILQDLTTFRPVPYELRREGATFLIDCEYRVFFYRTSRAPWLLPPGKAEELQHAILGLLGHELQSPATCEKYQGGSRGDHLACIIGHQRQYAQTPALTLWHKENLGRVDEFLKCPIIRRLNGWASSIVRLIFPGVAKRFDDSAEWHSSHNPGVEPLFGVFWNLCINAWFPGGRRIHTIPHSDSKNPVAVCVLLIYVLPGYKFNHQKRSWLVLWEAGVVIELPPWVLAAYPSSLFFHFNIDIQDIQFVTTEGGAWPTPENSMPISAGDDAGRGSLVWFNQASMYQASETGLGSVKEAKNAGQPGTRDYVTDAQQAFATFGKFVHVEELT